MSSSSPSPYPCGKIPEKIDAYNMITIIDYKTGNSGSILNVYRRIGCNAIITSRQEDIRNAEKLILPGVGSFDCAMKNLHDMNLIPVLEESILDRKTPLLGICIGMQIMASHSEEGRCQGLGWIDADIKKFQIPETEHLKIPHMGWNSLHIKQEDSIIAGVTDSDMFYFVHSYHYSEPKDADILATTGYGYEFPSLIKKENIYGIQCHPERSHASGILFLKNFAEMEQ